MDNNFTVIAALTTAVAAILAPLITSIITSIKEYRIEKLRLLYHSQIETLHDFTKVYYALPHNPTWEHKQRLQTSAANIAALCREKALKKMVLEFAGAIAFDGEIDEKTNKQFSKLICDLSKHIG